MPTVFTARTASASKKAPDFVDEKRTIMTPLTAFAVSPEGVRFETQEKEEEVVLFLREHLIVMLPSALLVLLLAISPVVLFPFLLHFLQLPVVIPTGYFIVGAAFWYVVTFGVAIMSFLRWYFNIYIVTDRRIVDIDFIHLLYKEFSEAHLDKIQDINYKSSGIFAAFFDYGDVFVQTSGAIPEIEFLAVPKPVKVVETISTLMEKRAR